MEGPLLRLLISSQSVKKHGHHREFLFLAGQFLKKSFPLTLLSWDKIYLAAIGSSCL